MSKNKIKKTRWKAGNMIYPLPAAMVSCGDQTRANIVTVGWTGTICTNPPMTYISLRPSRFSYDMIKESGYFVINLTTRDLAFATDFCGVKSGRDVDKFEAMGLTLMHDEETGCPMIGESPVSIVCQTKEIKELGSHHMFIADVRHIYVDEAYIDEKEKFHLNESQLIAYSHGKYLSLGEELGSFGYSICKKKKKEVKPQSPKDIKPFKQDSKEVRDKQKKNYKKTKSLGKVKQEFGDKRASQNKKPFSKNKNKQKRIK